MNLAMPGNPRYQPNSLVPFFGYDNLVGFMVEVELALLTTLAEAGLVPWEDIKLLTPEVRKRLLSITTTEVDEVERITKHDVRALVRIMQEILPEPLRRWTHLLLTSYDVVDTARALQFKRAHKRVVRPMIQHLVYVFRILAERYASTLQIGRTHGQHALPITVGFWLATILSRVLHNAKEMDCFADRLCGKVSGAVGAYNSQIATGVYEFKAGEETEIFEETLLGHLGEGLRTPPISTQILPPEPLAYYLFAVAGLSATLGQFGADSRQLTRTEIGEIAEPFLPGQVGSSTMAHKRNPFNFEILQGMWEGVQAEMGKVLSLLISEHQRDLVGSSLMRDLPTIVIRLVQQLDVLLRPDNEGVPFLERVVVNKEACDRNLAARGDIVLAELFYIALQIAGFVGDAHELVNHGAVKLAQREGVSLFTAIEQIAYTDAGVGMAWNKIPQATMDVLRDPRLYVGRATEKTLQVCRDADNYLRTSF